MATAVPGPTLGNSAYPTADGKPLAETDLHRKLMTALIDQLERWYAHDPLVYVTGNLLVFYVPGNKRRHVSPDVMVVRGVPRGDRLNYLIWEEGKGPDLVIELTSSSTRAEDTTRKFQLYRDTLKVQEYFLFDPFGDYLQPRLQGYRLSRGRYVAVRPVQGRLPSKVLGLHLERAGEMLRLYDPIRRHWLPTPQEELAQIRADVQRLQQEVEDLRRRLPQSGAATGGEPCS